MVTRLCIPLSVAALLCAAAPACKKDNAKPDPAALKDAAGTGGAAKSTDAAAAAGVKADAGAMAAAADAGAGSPPGADAEAAAGGDDKPKNLKALPKTWSTDKVTDYMKKQVSRGLGVKCEACHVKGDFASDTNKKKLAARKMIALTDGINRDFFKKKPEVTCFTCHKGKEEPAP